MVGWSNPASAGYWPASTAKKTIVISFETFITCHFQFVVWRTAWATTSTLDGIWWYFWWSGSIWWRHHRPRFAAQVWDLPSESSRRYPSSRKPAAQASRSTTAATAEEERPAWTSTTATAAKEVASKTIQWAWWGSCSDGNHHLGPTLCSGPDPKKIQHRFLLYDGRDSRS